MPTRRRRSEPPPRRWPTIVLVDKKGVIRYSHIGEGAYDKTESVIKQLLAEPS